MSMLLLVLVCTCAPTIIGQPHVEYLKGVERFNRSGYTDYYFFCSLTGDFIQWESNNEPLTGFHIQDAGRVVVMTRSMYEFTATLLSSQPPETDQRKLDSVLVLSFAGDHLSSFEVTCRSNSEFNTTRVDGLRGKATSSNGSNDEIALDHIASAEIVQDKNKTHIFICGAQNDHQFYDIQHDSSIAFTEHDNVGQVRSDLSRDGNLVNTQGVLIADHLYQRTSLLFITENSDVTVTCYFGTHHAAITSSEPVLTSNEPVASTDSPLTSTQTAPDTTTTTSGSLSSHTTYMQLSSTSYYEITDDGSSNKVAVTVGGIVGVLVVVISGVLVIVSAIFIYIKRKKFPPPRQTTDSTHVGSSTTELIYYRTSKKDAEFGETVSLDMERQEKKTEQNYYDESTSSCRHAGQISTEESSSGEDPLRVCESSTHHFGHEYGGTVKSFVSLQEPSFSEAHGQLQEFWNASASENVCPVFLPPITDSYSLKNAFSAESQDDPDVPVVVAAGNTLKMVCVHNKDSNGNVAEENIHITDETHDKVCVTDEDKDVHDDINNVDVTDEDKDVYNHVNYVDITDEDRDAHGDVNVDEDKNVHNDLGIADEGKDVHNNVGITDEVKDVHDNVYITHDAYITNDAHDHGHIRVIEEDEDAQSDKGATAKVYGAECEEKPYYYSHPRMEGFEELRPRRKFILRIKYSVSSSSFVIPLLTPYCYEKMCPEVDLEKKVDQTKQITAAKMLKVWDDTKPRCASMITSLKHSDGGSMNVIGGVYKAYTKRNAFLSMASLNVKPRKFTSKNAACCIWWAYISNCLDGNPRHASCKHWACLISTSAGSALLLYPCIRDLKSATSGGTLHVPVVGTSSRWGRVRLDLLK